MSQTPTDEERGGKQVDTNSSCVTIFICSCLPFLLHISKCYRSRSQSETVRNSDAPGDHV